MPERTRGGLAVVGAALAFGLAAHVLGQTVPGRLDVALGLVVLMLAGGSVVHRGLVPAPSGLAPLALPLALLTAALIWRDSATLFALNLLGIGMLAALASPRVRAAGRRRAGAGDYVRGAAQVTGGTLAGAAPLLLAEIDWRGLPEVGPVHRIRAALVGLVAAAPVAALFGGLLMEADPIFDRFMNAAVGVRLDRLAGDGARVLAWSWLGAGLLRLVLLRTPDRRDAGAGRGGRFAIVEVGTVLLVVDLLFLAFVAVQFRYLFAGSEMVRGLTGVSYAEYARQGFFQLVTVVALSLPLLLAADWALGRRDRDSLRRFRLLAGLMLALLNVMLASALWRMGLYTAEYGLTELRFYTTAFMGWLVLVLGWFGATVLRGRRERFAVGALTAALFALGALNLMNPDGLIAATNLARLPGGRAVDTGYLYRLSADAIPTLQRALPRLAPPDRCLVAGMLADRWTSELRERGRWNISYARASTLLRPDPGDCRRPPGG